MNLSLLLHVVLLRLFYISLVVCVQDDGTHAGRSQA